MESSQTVPSCDKNVEAKRDKGSLSAVTKVFNTVELVENILLHLPIKDIFVTTTVHPIIRDVVAGSTKLQKVMYRMHEVDSVQPGHRITINPLIDLVLQQLGLKLMEPYLDDDKLYTRLLGPSGQLAIDVLRDTIKPDCVAGYRDRIASLQKRGWQYLKITNAPVDIELSVVVNGGEQGISEAVVDELTDGRDRLGDVWDALHEELALTIEQGGDQGLEPWEDYPVF